MSSALRSKSKEKRAVSKDPHKASGKVTTNPSTGITVPTNGYNPLSGTFHALETAPPSSPPPIGEPEDQKEKTALGPSGKEAIPGLDSDKREKIRQKNEKKHQRQKERRAQELQERCSGYLMSRKLETLSQQLVGMGFSSERATMALIFNEGRVEESVAWLLEGGEDAENQREHNLDNGNLKIDISQELAWVAEMEIKFKCSKQEVERAVVTCDGDLEKAAETLRSQKHEPPKPEETGDPAKHSVAIIQNPLTSTTQSKPNSSVGAIRIQQKRDDKDFDHPRTAVRVGPPLMKPRSKSVRLLKKGQPKLDFAKQQQYGAASVSQASPMTSKTEAQSVNIENELKNLQLGTVREPVMIMQRPQPKQIPATSISSSPVTGQHSGGDVEYKLLSDHRSPINFQQQQEHYVSNYGDSNGFWNNMAGTSTTSPTLAAASSLGLFSGLGSNGGSNRTNWSADGSFLQLDYTDIDWSLKRLPLSPSWAMGSSSGADRTALRVTPASMVQSNGTDGVEIAGTRVRADGVRVRTMACETSAGGSCEWGSAFEENDMFSLPRQYVSSPSL